MNAYQEKYNELRKNYNKTNDIDPFFDFRTELEDAGQKMPNRYLFLFTYCFSNIRKHMI